VYAKRFASEGAAVVVAELDAGNGQRVAKEIEASGARAVAVTTDVADPASAQAMADTTVEVFGGIDILVNNAAIYGGMKLDALITVDLEYYRRFMEVNLNGALYCARAVYPSMQARGGGSVVNQSSTAAWMGGGYYSLAKAAINGLTHCLATELGPMNIRVNAIAPGVTDTEATRSIVPQMFVDQLLQQMLIKRMGTPEDMAAMCAFLCSDEAGWITGQIFAVDGGQTRRL
jgi:NAD(P)-dependent dehydrogenase (short-subunit alcohol dehydrogenase family)